MATRKAKQAPLRTRKHIASVPEQTKLPGIDTDRKITRHLKLADDLLVRRCWDKANAALSKLPSNRLIGRHETSDGIMLTHLEAMMPYALVTGDRDVLNDYLFPNGGTHYTDELLPPPLPISKGNVGCSDFRADIVSVEEVLHGFSR